MKKICYLLLVVFSWFLYSSNVKADVYHYSVSSSGSSSTYNNTDEVCGVIDSTIKSNSSTAQQTQQKIGKFTETVCDDKDYNILIFLDDSFSMSQDDKVGTANKLIKKIISTFKTNLGNNQKNSVVRLCFFHGECAGKADATTLDKLDPDDLPDDFKMKNKLDDDRGFQTANTNIQKQLKKAANKVDDYNNKVPFVIVITDGYPTESESDNAIDSSRSTDAGLSLGYLSTAKYFVRAIKTYKGLKSKIVPDGKIVNVAIMDTNDRLAKYFLNPTAANKNDLANDKFTEAHYLKSLIDSPSTTYYEAVAGVKSFPDFGLFHGKVTKKGNKDYRINFSGIKFTQEMKDAMTTDGFCSDGKCTFRFVFRLKNGVSTAQLRFRNGDWRTGFKNVSVSHINSNYYYVDLNYSDIDKSYSYGKERNNGSMKYENHKGSWANEIVLNIGANVDSSSIDVTNLSDDNVIDGLVISKNLNTLETGLADALNKGTCVEKEVFKVTNSTNVTSHNTNYNNNCIAKTFNVPGSFWYRQSDLGQIFKVNSSVKVRYHVCETLNYKFGSITPNEIYSGGGFDWTETKFSNDYYWQYSDIDNGVPVAMDITFEDVKDKMSYISMSSLCTNSNCSSMYNVNDLYARINEEFKKMIKADTTVTEQIRKEFFKTVDTNDANKKNDTFRHIVSVETDNSCNNPYKNCRTYNMTLPYAYSKDGTASTYEYFDAKKPGQDNLFRGQLRYVPLDYPTGDLDINVNGNFSSIDGISINVVGKCSIKVKQILYPEDPKEPKKVTYRYRSILIDDPFPKGPDTIPPNWKSWYAVANNKLRLENSYQNKSIYDVKFSKSDINRLQSGKSYVDWQSINDTGSSEFLRSLLGTNLFYANINNGSYCPKGQFFADCDKVRGGS